MSKEEISPIIRWLYGYVFRGLAWVFLAAVKLPAISFLQRFCQG
jgi:hypothetical protein